MFYTESTVVPDPSRLWRRADYYGRSDIMRFEIEPSQDLGLQHMLQNGVALLRGADLGAERRQQVLDGVLEVVTDADRGREALQEQSLTFARNDRPALERFSLFLSYLGDDGQLPQRLAEAKNVIQSLEDDGAVAQEKRNAAADLLESLVVALKRERALAPLPGPREIYSSSTCS